MEQLPQLSYYLKADTQFSHLSTMVSTYIPCSVTGIEDDYESTGHMGYCLSNPVVRPKLQIQTWILSFWTRAREKRTKLSFGIGLWLLKMTTIIMPMEYTTELVCSLNVSFLKMKCSNQNICIPFLQGEAKVSSYNLFHCEKSTSMATLFMASWKR